MIRINILIPVNNQLQGLRNTLLSIKTQDMPQENIFTTIVDFGSIDGSYEEALSHTYHTGVYKVAPVWRHKSLEVPAAAFWKEVHREGSYTYDMILTPGDILYPQFLSRCTELMIAYISKGPSILICETDIFLRNGQKMHQQPLYDEITMIDGKKPLTDFISKGFLHSIICFGGSVINKSCHQWWQNMIMIGIDKNILYVPETLACIQEPEYEDELGEILFQWGNTINISRCQQSFYSRMLGEEIVTLGESVISLFSLWRAYKLLKKERYKDMEDCLLIAEVIDPKIRRFPILSWMENCLQTKSILMKEKIEEFFHMAEEKTIQELEKIKE